ncbi:4-oxalocrotonate decarboxylase [Pyxidicoccus fallax]|uniref:4-oxalocrotonate decarboxylase n=1 Tax=Pyxidicoccus fallax TaxID=394095 RepID=A0A848LU57_9BACT|nr:fumarylacetoacetate hydrolase family protein [Pyxidicoccus fallax]NMO21132.1 4-oxalocrotonate decarboxylase [Pyxidicoccus fallax]NPC85701.1 4-oxalocrotonate decarboxylase [Pyxidicoccus fallax]
MTATVDHQELARALDAARLERREVAPLTREVPQLSLPDAYAIQEAGIRLRLSRGERVVGLKMGLTSEAKRRQMNLDSPVYGVLTDRMQVPADGVVRLSEGIHPKIEPEIAFRIGRELKGKVTRDEALDACVSVFAAMEILDSRYRDFKYFSLPDVVADNSSSSLFVLGTAEHPPRAMDLTRLEMKMSVNGEVVQAARSDAISGDPVVSLLQLCELLAERGQVLPAGSIVLAGAATAAHMLKPGDRVQLTVEGLGSVAVSAA